MKGMAVVQGTRLTLRWPFSHHTGQCTSATHHAVDKGRLSCLDVVAGVQHDSGRGCAGLERGLAQEGARRTSESIALVTLPHARRTTQHGTYKHTHAHARQTYERHKSNTASIRTNKLHKPTNIVSLPKAHSRFHTTTTAVQLHLRRK